MPYKKQHREERVAYYYDGQPVMEHVTKECKEYHLETYKNPNKELVFTVLANAMI